MNAIKRIIAVASGKGGVGKSTVSGKLCIASIYIYTFSVNLAAALVKERKRVGLLDADLFGPSLPTMMGLKGKRPVLTGEKEIIPLSAYGIECMSIGLIAKEGAAVVWRGLMVTKAIEQLLNQVRWGSLDYLVIDLPPGTGDVQLTLAQKAHIDAAMIVSTPQQVAIDDVRKACAMFDELKIPVQLL